MVASTNLSGIGFDGTGGGTGVTGDSSPEAADAGERESQKEIKSIDKNNEPELFPENF